MAPTRSSGAQRRKDRGPKADGMQAAPQERLHGCRMRVFGLRSGRFVPDGGWRAVMRSMLREPEDALIGRGAVGGRASARRRGVNARRRCRAISEAGAWRCCGSVRAKTGAVIGKARGGRENRGHRRSAKRAPWIDGGADAIERQRRVARIAGGIRTKCRLLRRRACAVAGSASSDCDPVASFRTEAGAQTCAACRASRRTH